MPRDEQTVKSCRVAITSLLKEYAEAPLFNMREEDFRSALLQKLREKIEGKVNVVLKKGKSDDILPIDEECREKAFTSRVHAEVRLTKKRPKRKSDKEDHLTHDVVVLKDKQVILRVKQSCADVLERLEPDDAAVIIEIKAAPSNRQHKKFEKDIRKLRSKELGDARRLLAVIDKSMPLGMPTLGRRKPNLSWRKSLKRKGKSATDVEVWFLNEKGEPDSMFDIHH